MAPAAAHVPSGLFWFALCQVIAKTHDAAKANAEKLEHITDRLDELRPLTLLANAEGAFTGAL